MQTTVGELAAQIDGTLLGPGETVVKGAAPLADAGPGDITLVDETARPEVLDQSQAAAVVGPRGFTHETLPVIQVDNVHLAFAQIASLFHPVRSAPHIGISPKAEVSPDARLDENVEVHSFVTIADDVEIGRGTTIHSGVQIMAGAKIGPDVTIFPNVVIYEDTVIGARCTIHASAVLGGYGFGYTCENGRHQPGAQLGNVVLEADVEVGAGTTIDRGTYGSTVIGEGTKIDNQVMVAHNCRIGRHNILCSQVGIAGSTTTGDYVVMAGQVGVKDHVHIGSGAVLGAMAGIIGDVADGERMVGIPATPYQEQKKKQFAWLKLPEMRKQFKQMKTTVARLCEELEALQQAGGQETEKPTGDDGECRAVA